MQKDSQKELLEKLKKTSNLKEDHLEKLFNAIINYIDAEETYESVEKHFKNGNIHKGSYAPLALYFLNIHIKYSSVDKCYKKWLEDIFDTEQEKDFEKNLKESVVLSCLKEKYTTKEALKNFIFNPFLKTNEDQPIHYISQKWHFFISYWGYKEYVTLYPKNNSENKYEKIVPLPKSNGFKCPELRAWCEAADETLAQKN